MSAFACQQQKELKEVKKETGKLNSVMDGNRGLEKLDIGALSTEQQEKLRQFKIKTKIDNERYLRDHPEVEMMLSGFLREVLLQRPTDIREFAADHFSDPDLPEKIQAKVEQNASGKL